MTLISPIRVDDEGPIGAKILLVGEAPGGEEEKEGRPFIGESGNILTNVLLRNGLKREDVRLANLCHYRPQNNKFENLLDSPQLAEGIKELYSYIREHRPQLIIPLGNWPNFFITGKGKIKKSKGKLSLSGIMNWRGSILSTHPKVLSSDGSNHDSIKAIPTVHPAAVLRDRTLYPTFDQDIARAARDADYSDLRLPARRFIIAPKHDELEYWVNELLKADKLAVDIENVKASHQLLCVGFAPSPALGVCIAYDPTSAAVRDALDRLLSSPVPKIFHFGTHDTELLRLNGYRVNNYSWDTMIAQHVMWPELPRSLAYITSIHTREPYYKDMVKEEDSDTKAWSAKIDRKTLYEYNCKDVCVTIECQIAQEQELKEGPKSWKKFFDFEMALLAPAHAIMQTGMLIDPRRRDAILTTVEKNLAEQQLALNQLVGTVVNVNSTPQVQTLVYEALKLPKRHKRSKDGPKLTADEDALLASAALCKEKIDSLSRKDAINEWKRKLAILRLIILIRGGRKMKSSYLDVNLSPDGRARSRVKVAATDTARWAMEKYVDNTGLNAQTFPRDGVEVPVELLEESMK